MALSPSVQGRHNQALETNQRIVHVTNVINKNYQQINNTINQHNRILNQTNNITMQVQRNQRSVNSALRSGKSEANGLWNKLKGIATVYLSFQGAKTIAGVSDEYVNTLARLNLINDGLQTTAELQEKIFAAADRARGSYTDLAGVIGRMGILASEAFESNDELIAFSELMQKSFQVGGASTMEQQAGMYQLSQALAAGRLQGDEFRSIMENAPMLAKAISDFTGWSMGELKEKSADGAITAEIIVASMFNAADEINAKFAEMPTTFGRIFNEIANIALREFGPAIQRISEMLNDERMKENMKGVGSAIAAAAVAAVQFLGIVGEVYNFITGNWTAIEPILWGIVGAVIAWRVAQWGLNIALNANPIGVVIMTVAALIGIIIAVVKWVINLWKTNDDFAAGLMRAWNAILNFFDQVPIFFTRVGFGIANAFDWAKIQSLQSVEMLVNGVIDSVNWLIDKLNKIPGVSLDAISTVEYSAAEEAAAEARRQARADALAEMEEDALAKAMEREQKVLDMLDSRARERAEQEAKASEEEPYDFSQFAKDYSQIENIDKVGEVEKIRDTVDISSEDLKMMRELAEMRNIQNFVTLTPQISVQTGDIRETVDTQAVIASITDQLATELESSARGVYA